MNEWSHQSCLPWSTFVRLFAPLLLICTISNRIGVLTHLALTCCTQRRADTCSRLEYRVRKFAQAELKPYTHIDDQTAKTKEPVQSCSARANGAKNLPTHACNTHAHHLPTCELHGSAHVMILLCQPNICPRCQCGGDRQAHMHPADRFTPVLSSGPSNCATTEQCSTYRMAVPVAACRSHLLYLLQCAATTGEQHRQVASGTECPLYTAGPPGLEGAVRGGTMPQPAACASAVPQPPQSHHALPSCCMLP